jgi:hypothetical protein
VRPFAEFENGVFVAVWQGVIGTIYAGSFPHFPFIFPPTFRG